ISSNSADFFAAGLKGRFQEQKKYTDHIGADGFIDIETIENGQIRAKEVALRNGLNEVLRSEYIKDSERALARWNKFIAEEAVTYQLYLPNPRFHRHVGEYAGHYFDIHGNLISEEDFNRHLAEWLPTMEDREYVRSLMVPVTEPGKLANWIAPPTTGINNKP